MTPIPTTAPQFSFTFNPSISFGDIISLLTFLGLIVGGIFALVRWFKDKAIKRAEFINELNEKIRSDKDIRKWATRFDYFDYDDPWYDESFHASGELELAVDKTLSYYSYICYLRDQSLISRKEFRFFKYKVTRILSDYGVQDYLYNIYHFAKEQKLPVPFYYIVKYGLRNHLLDEDFKDPKAYETATIEHEDDNGKVQTMQKYHDYVGFDEDSNANDRPVDEEPSEEE